MIERKICLINESILPSEKEHLTFLSCPPKNKEDNYTFVTEAGHGTTGPYRIYVPGGCPKKLF